MQKTLAIKIGIIALLCGIFTIGLAMFSSVITERQYYANNVIADIAKQHVKPQQIITPFFITRHSVSINCTNSATNQSKANTNSQKTTDAKEMLPSSAKQNSCEENSINLTPTFANSTKANQALEVSNNIYQRSIYAATSYEGNVNFTQTYKIKELNQTGQSTQQLSTAKIFNNAPENTENTNKETQDKYIDTRLLIPISDLRGITKMPEVVINDQKFTASYPDNQLILGLNYLEVILPNTLKNSEELNVSINLNMAGLEQLKTSPLGDNFKITTNANWHAPNFIGQALPNKKSITDTGFNATWQNQHIAMENNQYIKQCIADSQQYCSLNDSNDTDYNNRSNYSPYEAIEATSASGKSYSNAVLNSFGVDFAQPNNVYLQTDRTLKYALLIIAVSFGSFFLFEVIKSLRIHPIQYLLVGMALLVFYALLLSLAEQIAFWQAYVIAASACAGLIGWYAFYVLHSGKRALLFTFILAAQYAGFYTILTMEELNLLVGAVFCFVLIASVMFLTRKIDWYKIA